MAEQDKARQDKARQDKARQGAGIGTRPLRAVVALAGA